ncbi:MFS transporter [Streptomyces acidiscabies]|uniref:MFS transporter n=1 Tax=Streptomyces acidiscabies TaxID=42234 RepID=UPI000952883E|nr:MFS transporter [Streptomyces acidiscabies]GAV38942.1 tetracycline resistance protein, class B [Streptomyces acidiscabies]
MTRTTASPPFIARLLIVGSGIMSLANSFTVPFLAVFLRRELGLDPSTVGLIVGSSVFFSVLAGFVGGSLSDILGRPRLLLLSLLGVVASFLGFYVSHHILAVFACNAALSMSAASFGPVGKAMLSDVLPDEKRVKWFSYQYLALNVGFAVGPLVGGFAGLSGGRTAFLISAAVYTGYLALLGLTLLFNPGARTVKATEGERLGSVLRGLRDSARVVATDRRLLWFIVAGLLLESVHGKISALLAQHLAIGFHDGTTILGYLLTTNAVTVVGFQMIASRFSGKRDPVTSIILGGLLLFAGMVGFAASRETWQFVVAMVVFSVGETFIVPAEFAIIDRIAPGTNRGSYFGAQTFAQFGGFVGPSAGGLLLTGFGGTAMFLGVGSLALVSVAIYVLVGRRIPGIATPAHQEETREPA